MIRLERLKNRMLQMAKIGGTENNGVTRLALSQEDKKGRDLFVKWMQELKLDVRIDDFGNIYGRKEGTDPRATAVMVGSHLDSVPKGGRFDGVLGVLAGLEVIESLIENNVEHENPIEIVSFTNEEGARFTPQMLGSGAVTNQFSKEYTYSRKDKNNFIFCDELEKIGYLGKEENRLKNVGAFIEFHIEQGPILEMNNKTIGIVEGISGFSWLEVTVIGETNHSGSTPMELRKDALSTTAITIQAIQKWAEEKEDGTVATIGTVRAEPGIINAVPGKVVFTLDVRNGNKEQFNFYMTEIQELIKDCVQRESLNCTIQEIKAHSPVSFASWITNIIEEVSVESKVPYQRITSGAGHDAMYLNTVTDTAMIFVPSIGGKSHCVEEYTPCDDIEKGINILYKTICRILTSEKYKNQISSIKL
ncbi:Zn-dependent hydrolase [Virgibacillus halodenitrificans]|uniref:Zn-dependent hydrolase n=1 Tax=Virgibacillus halodenitrificans TaxID=1482 RepID=A0ABR7VGV5_VIRHA|nr:Zn-dependent hydrolase [Virgibacillus halodenitrificans]MBD1221176.1 Zn-dependent hydrolase [Virgibacillus halodenitrificans]